MGQNSTSLKEIDSLSYLSYDELNKKVNVKDTLNTLIAIKSYLKKARRERDTIRQARAYRGLIIFNRTKNIIPFADSIIKLTKNRRHKLFPTIGYFFKGSAILSRRKSQVGFRLFY